MPALPSWDDMASGKDCPFCKPRGEDDGFNIKIADLSVSTLYLDRNQFNAGYSVLIFKKRHVCGIELLDETEYTAYMQDLRKSAQALNAAVTPDHMNYATLGNAIPHLHYHIIPRYKSDAAWGRSNFRDKDEKILTPAEYAAQIAHIRNHLTI